MIMQLKKILVKKVLMKIKEIKNQLKIIKMKEEIIILLEIKTFLME